MGARNKVRKGNGELAGVIRQLLQLGIWDSRRTAKVSSFPGGSAPYAAGGTLGYGLVPGRCALVATLRMMLMLMLVKGPVKPGKSGMAPQARADADRAQGMPLMPEFES